MSPAPEGPKDYVVRIVCRRCPELEPWELPVNATEGTGPGVAWMIRTGNDHESGAHGDGG